MYEPTPLKGSTLSTNVLKTDIFNVITPPNQ